MDFDTLDDQTDLSKKLDATQAEVTAPDYAGAIGLGRNAPAPAPQPASWSALVKDHPVLSQHMVDPQFASAAKDDVQHLSLFERIFGGATDMAWSTKQALDSDTRTQRLAFIGRQMKAGQSTPAMESEADDLDKEAAQEQTNAPHMGLLPGVVPGTAGVAPGLLRATPTAAVWGAAGTALGLLLTKNEKAALAIGGSMAGWGLNVGMAKDTAETESGLAYRQYVKAGADPKTAAIASDLVALGNGGLQLIPAEKIFNLVPGLQNLLAGRASRDLVGKLITSNTGRAALGRLALRSQESGLLMGLVSMGQELVREAGAVGSGTQENVDLGKVAGAFPGGWQQGTGFGLAHSAAPYMSEKSAADLGANRQTMYNAIAGVAQKSKLLESMPDAFKSYANAVIQHYGNAEEMKIPAGKLNDLFQKEGITPDQIADKMPGLSKQLETARPNDEMVIPTADVATHLAKLTHFQELTPDIRIGDDPTPREYTKIGELADEYEEKQGRDIPKGDQDVEEKDPARKVYNDVYDQLTRAGQAPEVATKDAALWAAFARTRGERMGVDPFEYYKNRNVSIGAEFPDTPGTTLEQKYEPGKEYSFDISKLSLDDQNLKEAEENIRRGSGSVTDGPVKLYRREGTQKLEVGDGHHRIVEAIQRGESSIKGTVDPDVLPAHTLEQPAYHGTPHKFDKFTLDHIGSGEGAQAYGWGLYFAESESVARFYKNNLGEPKLLAEPKEVQTSFMDQFQSKIDNLEAQKADLAEDPAPSDRARMRRIDIDIRDLKERINEVRNSEQFMGETFDTTYAHNYAYDNDLNEEGLIDPSKGYLHSVDLPDKSEFLDYDKSIPEQPPGVLRKLQEAGLIDETPKEPHKLLEEFLQTDYAKSFEDGTTVRIVKRYIDEFKRGEISEKDIQDFLDKRMADSTDAINNLVLKASGGTFYDQLARKLGGSKEASLALHEAGIPGMIYLDQGSRNNAGGTHNFVVWDENAISALKDLEQQGTNGYRGKISFDEARSFFNVTLTGKANLSTFLHESGHAFLEFMRKDAETDGATKADLDKLEAWMGSKSTDVEGLEKFARGFEAYLMEGKAPAPGLRDLFRTFSAWLKSIYQTMRGLNVNLTDEVRGVMDRMLATDPEIEKARKGLGLEPMKKPDGMTDAEYDAYREKFSKAMDAGRKELEDRAIKEFRNTIGEFSKQVRADVEEKTKMDPAHNAYEVLTKGKRLDGGEVSPELKGVKLDRESVKESGYEGIKWANMTAKEGGMDPDVAAPLLGYENGPKLLEALDARPSRTRQIKEETEARMKEMYPDADMAKMREQAVKALHENEVGNVLWLEAKAIGKQVGKEHPATAKEVVKEIARRRTEDMTALEMQPGKYARAEERAAGEWADAMQKKDFATAHASKLDQILNHEMFKAVSAGKDEVDGIRNYLDKFNDLNTRKKLGKAGQSYLGAVDTIIQDIELTRQTNKTLDRRMALESYLKEMEVEDGADLSIPEDVRREAALKNYKTMTLNELRTVRDAVANIEHMARLKNKIFDGRERRALNETAVRAAADIAANLGTKYAEKPGDPQNPGKLGQIKDWLRKGNAELKKIEFIARSLDGGQIAGRLHELLFQPFATSDAKKQEMNKKVTQELLKPYREMSMKERFALDKTVDFNGTPMKVRDVIAVALNMGNEGNKKKLLDGYRYRGWNEANVTKRLGEVLTDKHLDLIQHTWDTINTMWPDIKSLSERSIGIAPPKVEASKLIIRGRELEGGYYPIVYDPKKSYMAEQISQRKTALFENNFLKPGVSKGFTESRVEYPNPPPIQLSLGVIPSHINEVIHYLTHYEAARAVDRLVAHPAMRRAITEAMGRDTYNLFRPWLQAIAQDGAVSPNTTMVDQLLAHTRAGASITRLGFRLTNTIMQGFNILSSVKELGGVIEGPKYLARGMKTWMGSIDKLTSPFADVEANSPEIAGKTKKLEDNLVGELDRYTSAFSEYGHYKRQLGHFALSFMGLAWKSVETLTWYAAREKAFDEQHARPEEYADSVVRTSQMGEGIKDKAAIMRGGEGTKIFTYMYSWYSTIFNQLTEQQPQARGGWQKAGELASRYWWMVVAPTVMMSMARGEHDRDEEGMTPGYMAGQIAMESIKSLTGPTGGLIGDTLFSGHEARFAPWISTVLRGIALRGKLAAGDKHLDDLTDKEKKDLWESSGILAHMPTGAMYNAIRYVEQVQNGELQEPIRDLLLRSPGDYK